jgi:branched-chain amino acid transport system substrate-binding protein
MHGTSLRTLCVIAALTTAGLSAAACGSSGGGGGGGGSASAAKLAGAPVKIGIVQDVGAPGNDHPEGIAAAKAAASYVNAHGGFVGNRPVQIISCNAMGSPTASKQCAEEFVSDKVVAVGGVAADFPTSGLPVLQPAGIPYVGLGVSAQDFSNPVSYPMFSPVAAGFPAQVTYFAKQGVKSAAIIEIDIPEAVAAASITLVKPFEALGIKAVSIAAPAGAADMTSYVEKALQAKPQVIFQLQDAADAIRVAQSAAQLGFTGSFAPAGTDSAYFTQLSASAVKKSIVVVSTNVATSNPQEQVFTAALSQYASGTAINEYSADEFAEVMTLQTICKSLGAAKCTAADILSTVKDPHDIPIFMGKALDASTPVVFGGAPTHVFNPWVRMDALNTNGTYSDVGNGWIKG